MSVFGFSRLPIETVRQHRCMRILTRVVVFLSPCAWLETAPDGQTTMQSFKLGDVLWAKRNTHGGETSRVVQECSLLEIELK